ncbi:MAG: hypothetical protein FRX48_05227 [Lasallia pustulata]|uniref:Uncharacterized protein n=1 Tax=Lasallia pustulata TaxID=136370 RepID=A0A5M8PPK4_9LECA|nr:MAG: hypothetical protein FRX48_05227 [Lasallia pustulata]
MVQTPETSSADLSMVLSEIVELLSVFSKSNPREFTELLVCLERKIEGLKEEYQQKQTRPQIKQKQRVSYKAGTSQQQGLSVAVTRSHPLLLQDKPTSPLHSYLEFKDVPETFEQQPASDFDSIINCQPSVSTGVAEITVVAPKDISLQVNDGLHVARSDKAVRVKLKQKVQDCKTVFHEQSFTISSDGHLETVNPNEINGFFSRFEE